MCMVRNMIENFDQSYLKVTALFTIIYQLCFFSVAFYFKFDKVTDFAGGTNFVILAFMTYFGSQPVDFRATVATALVAVWGARLSGFLLYRILKTNEDSRFDELRGDFFKFLGFWVFQMVWVWVCSLPVIMVNSAGNSSFAPEFGLITDILGVAMFVVGLIVETLADSAKFAFRESQPKPLDILRTGVWKYSRHPNYFGEIFLWWGMYLLCLPVSSKTGVYTVASPLFISWLLLFVSGIPLSEPPKEKKYVEADKQAEYQDYIDSTSPLIPMPNETYRAIPNFVKSTFLFEFPLYRYNPDGKEGKAN